MGRTMQGWRSWALLGVGLVVLGAVVVSVLAGEEDQTFTATSYADVVRFKAEGVASLQVGIYDLSGQEVWASGVRTGQIVDWERTNEWGERLAYGVYLYSAQGWDANGDSVFQKHGKLALLPGDEVRLQAAPLIGPAPDSAEPSQKEPWYSPMAYDFTDLSVSGQLGVGTDSPSAGYKIHVKGDPAYMLLEPTGINPAWRCGSGK